MLPLKNRLKKRKDIEKVVREGQKNQEGFLILKMTRNNLRESRFAFVVSRKVSKKATVRNKLKRRLREVIRLKIDEIKPGFDIVLIALPGLEKKDFSELETIINKTLEKTKALKRL